MDAAGIVLRPHAKSHKSIRIARMQLDAGAVGICVAKVSEAERWSAGWSPVRGDRLRLVPPRCDPTVDRHERIWLTRADTVVDVAVVTARGHSY